MEWRLGWMAASIALVSALTGWLIARHMAPEPNFEARPVRFTVQPPDNTAYREGRVSPDGRWLAFIGIDTSGVKQLWVQALDSLIGSAAQSCRVHPILVSRQQVYCIWSGWKIEAN